VSSDLHKSPGNIALDNAGEPPPAFSLLHQNHRFHFAFRVVGFTALTGGPRI
jgi:hypothetical protein